MYMSVDTGDEDKRSSCGGPFSSQLWFYRISAVKIHTSQEDSENDVRARATRNHGDNYEAATS